MQIDRDVRPEYFAQLEGLLYGMNYQIWIGLYGPLETQISLQQALKEVVSKDAVVGGSEPVAQSVVRSQIMESLLYPGDPGSGPIDLEEKRGEIMTLAQRILSDAHLEDAQEVTAFWFAKGHPAYPVFWDFAYDIHAQGRRWILVGSSSD
ncbi:hypothetical protein [Pseudomonas sp.]|uniref:Uncharacterized protein n=1 Tax=Cereibacter sphaeroides TaxID=1063 RepID=A0A2W5U8Q0_CERSP|nr:hypothetical protein [Pseudomonas sp.]MDU4253104.1 hypothetical protein [Pseudomonas sp.]PZQ94290.1 MAG: hypothetical protein DI533_22550 [Cereibacter sphaeroides]